MQEEKVKAHKKEKRKERKRKAEPEEEAGDPDMAALMGFSGFGSSKKWFDNVIITLVTINIGHKGEGWVGRVGELDMKHLIVSKDTEHPRRD